MIQNALEFYELRNSLTPKEYQRAAEEAAPLEVWQEVLEIHPEMAFWVAHNKTVPLEILESLAKHSDAKVRGMVASKNKLSEALLLQLATDPEDSVRMSVARHKNATKAVLLWLVLDAWTEISRTARARIESGLFLKKGK